MTILKKKDEKETEQLEFDENLFFDLTQEIILTEDEAKALEKSLINIKIDNELSEFSKSNHQFYKKLKKNNFTISLEDLERL